MMFDQKFWLEFFQTCSKIILPKVVLENQDIPITTSMGQQDVYSSFSFWGYPEGRSLLPIFFLSKMSQTDFGNQKQSSA